MFRILGVLAGGMAWLGWLAICPALGFPTLATAAMLNRVFVPREDPGSWLGWALLLIGLASAAFLYLAAADRSRWRPSIASGAVYGAICWLLAGAVVMPLLGLAVPSAAPTTPAALTPPDPMRGSFMMLHLGVAAPIAALVAWLVFGAVVGAMSALRPSDPSPQPLAVPGRDRTDDPRTLRTLLIGAAFSIVVLLAIGLVATRLNITPTDSTLTGSRTLETGPVEALPEGGAFFSIVELPQAAGATLGAHAHVPGFAYSLDGVATITFHDGRTIRVAPGEAGFMAAQAVHSHINAEDRVPAAALALLIVALAGFVCVTSVRRTRGARVLPMALVVLVAAGALGVWNPWSNDWLFLSIRPVAARGAPMPLPTASRTYESPDLGELASGPYVEALDEIRLAGGAVADIGSAGAAVLLVLDGRVEVQSADEPSIQIGARGATQLQPGASVRVTNAGDRPAHLLKFAVTPAPGGSTAPSGVVVPATANIFGAGHDTAPAPGGGGGGTVPPVWPLPSGATRIVTVAGVTGEVNPIVNFPEVGSNGPGGDLASDTDVESVGGISGVVHHGNGMFLVGVFLTDDPPADPAPARLDFTDSEEFELLEPEIGQTFFIGDGKRASVPGSAGRDAALPRLRERLHARRPTGFDARRTWLL